MADRPAERGAPRPRPPTRALTLVLLVLAGCAPDTAAPPVPTLAADASPDPYDGVASEDPTAADGGAHTGPDAAVEPPIPGLPRLGDIPFARRLPAGALAAGAVIAPIGLDGHLGLDRLLAAADPWGDVLRERGQAFTGHDLSNVRTWTRLSIAPDHPITAAVLDLEPPVVAVGWHTADVELMRTLVHVAIGGLHPLVEAMVGGATLLSRRDGEGPVIGWEGDTAWVVFGPDLHPGEALYHARRLALPTSPTMTEQPHIAALLDRVEPEPVGIAVIDLPTLVQRGLRTAAEDPGIETLRRGELADRSLGLYAAANRKAQSRLRLQSLDLISQARLAARTQLIRSAAYPFGPAALELHLSPGELRARWVQPISVGSLPARLLPLQPASDVPFEGPPGAPGALSLRLDPQTLYQWTKGLMVIADRGDLARFEADLRALTGVAFERELIDPFPGELALHLAPDPLRPVPAPGIAAVVDVLRPVARWRTSDPAGLHRTLDRLARPLDALEPTAPGQYALQLGGLPRLWLDVGADALAATLDLAPPAQADPSPAGAPDGGPGDGGASDAGPTDATVSDARPDTARPDAGAPDGAMADGARDPGDAGAADVGPSASSDRDPAVGLRITLAPERLAALLVERGALPIGTPPVDLGLSIARHIAAARLVIEPWEDGFAMTVTAEAPAGDLARALSEIIADVARLPHVAGLEGGEARWNKASSTPESLDSGTAETD